MKSFGMGIGYSTRTNEVLLRSDDERVNTNLRADSFGLYAGRVADRILRNILLKANFMYTTCHKQNLKSNILKAIEEKKRKDSSTPMRDSSRSDLNSSIYVTTSRRDRLQSRQRAISTRPSSPTNASTVNGNSPVEPK